MSFQQYISLLSTGQMPQTLRQFSQGISVPPQSPQIILINNPGRLGLQESTASVPCYQLVAVPAAAGSSLKVIDSNGRMYAVKKSSSPPQSKLHFIYVREYSP